MQKNLPSTWQAAICAGQCRRPQSLHVVRWLPTQWMLLQVAHAPEQEGQKGCLSMVQNRVCFRQVARPHERQLVSPFGHASWLQTLQGRACLRQSGCP